MSYSNRASGIIAVLRDRPVAYHPKLALLLGVKEAIFLCQLLYWDGKGALADGWIWKTQANFEEETGLSRTEQETARRNLKKFGILEEKLAQIPAKLHYRINFETLGNVVELGYPRSSMRKPPSQDCGNPANKDAESDQTITETTTSTLNDNPDPVGSGCEQPKPSAIKEPSPPRAKAKRQRSPHQETFAALRDAFRIPQDVMTGDQRGRLNRLSKAVRKGGYDIACIALAEKDWWKSWPGSTGRPPNDGQFLQRLEIAHQRRLAHDRQWSHS